jgi:hypothetical protein
MPNIPTGPNADTNPDTDNNICTHSEGYVPRLDLCPNPNDEFCGLLAYKVSPGTIDPESLDPQRTAPLPTDVTLGHYTPLYLGFVSTRLLPSAYSYVAYYTPRPPVIAAPNVASCASPGQCQIQRMDSISLDGQSEGSLSVTGGKHKATVRFYAWGAHNQMPLRQVLVDWGDGNIQQLPDAKLKNHKPYCNVQKECSDPIKGAGITCQTDNDCPPGTGTCLPLGSCVKRPNISCRSDADCSSPSNPDVCQIRTMFGNSQDACEQNYFEFAHLYACNGPAGKPNCSQSATEAGRRRYIPPNTCYFGDSYDDYIFSPGGADLSEIDRPSCTNLDQCLAWALTRLGGADAEAYRRDGASCGPPSGSDALATRCSRDPARLCSPTAPPGDRLTCAPGDTCVEGLAPPGGCWDATVNSCRYTPRVMVVDNWGWCTGECRNSVIGGTLVDGGVGSSVRHDYGGCYSGGTIGAGDPNVFVNTSVNAGSPTPQRAADKRIVQKSECNVSNPGSTNIHLRPWIVYPGSLYLRTSGELGR